MLMETFVGNFKAMPVINVATKFMAIIMRVSPIIIPIFAKNRCILTIKPILMKNKLMKRS